MLSYWLYILLVLPFNLVKTHICNCMQNKCNFDGSCQPNYRCKDQFFGYFCEYNNINIHEGNSVYQLADKDYRTCVKRDDFEASYPKTRIYMIRLIVRDSMKFLNLSVAFKDSSKEERECDGHLILPETTIVEYYCSILDYSNGIILRGLEKNEICHLHLTDGRNMAAGASILTKALSFDDNFYKKEGLIDGNRLYEKHHCFLTKPYDKEFKLDIYLRTPSMVNFVEILDSHHFKLPADGLAKTSVDFLDTSKRKTLSALLDVSPWRALYRMYGIPVLTVSLYRKGQFGACEIEVRGDCSFGLYGFDCKSICKPRCKDFRCTSKGLCIGCKEGLIGPRCCHRFCNPNKDCGDNGNCINGCIVKKYGIDCSQDCSHFCAGDGSCDITGKCLAGCKTGSSGGPNCIEKCEPPQFGLYCNETCSETCHQRLCSDTGHCMNPSPANDTDDKEVKDAIRGSHSYGDRVPSTPFMTTITLFLVARLAFL